MPTGPGASTRQFDVDAAGLLEHKRDRQTRARDQRCPEIDQEQVIAAGLQRHGDAGGSGEAVARTHADVGTQHLDGVDLDLPGRRAAGRDQAVGFRARVDEREKATGPFRRLHRLARPGTVDFDRPPRRGRGRFGFAAEPFQQPAYSISFSLRPTRACARRDRPLLLDAPQWPQDQDVPAEGPIKIARGAWFSPNFSRSAFSGDRSRRGPFGRPAPAAH